MKNKILFILFAFCFHVSEGQKFFMVQHDTTIVSGGGGSNGFHRVITIDHTKVSTTDHTDFTSVYSETFTELKSVANGGKVQDPQGDDIYISTDAAGTSPVSFKLKKWNAVTGAVVIEYKISTLHHSTDDVFYLQYGKTSITTFQGGATGSEFDSHTKIATDFGDGSTLDVTDKSGNGNNGTNSSATATAGLFAGGVSFNGTNAIVSYPDLTSITDYTISAWIKPNSLGAGSTQCAFGFETYPASPRDAGLFWSISSEVSNDRPTGKVIVSNTGSAAAQLGALSTGTWYYCVIQRSGTSANVYINGAVISATLTVGSGATSVLRPTLASHYYSGADHEFYDGAMSIFKFIDVARSSAWTETEYNNYSSPSTFCSTGAEVAN